ncbi:hypothetical protein Pyn_25262 [Prunus yedoensis var. nudiflora]|uniref:COBRA C-terminal domain-containing protein n=1 Tax=Prunus yedoensis var. nudiflora TaxID=2094558 RepID=A0A314YBU1_PRUYE|nr:hypothetical protein Pyn_25262 [Prunus yedoensis var. nudiflora]
MPWLSTPPSLSLPLELKLATWEGSFSGHPPLNLTLKAPGPGYTCGPLKSVDPTVSLDFGGKRQRQVFRTWKAICTYSSFLASQTPVCCVSLSSFYNPEITSCPKCSCGCREVTDKNFGTCLRPAYPFTAKSPTGDNSGANFMGAQDPVKCTDHMCPIRVHWHVKTSYVDHWRIKLTITNYNYQRNFSNWNVLVQHPGLSMNPITYSFNSTLLQPGFRDAVALFWGIAFVNEELIATDKDGVGSVSTEILLEKTQNHSHSKMDGLFQEGYISMEKTVRCPYQTLSQCYQMAPPKHHHQHIGSSFFSSFLFPKPYFYMPFEFEI